MKNRLSWKIILLVLSFTAAVAFLVPSTLSFLFAKTNPIVNTFIPAQDFSALSSSVDIAIQKTVLSTGDTTLSPEGFLFSLEDMESETSLTASANADGNTIFHLAYDYHDVGKTYRYRVTEVHDNRQYVTYSDASYLVEVTISYLENELTLSVTVDGLSVSECTLSFENIYDPLLPPDTGDNAPLSLYLLLMFLSAAALVILTRRRTTSRVK